LTLASPQQQRAASSPQRTGSAFDCDVAAASNGATSASRDSDAATGEVRTAAARKLQRTSGGALSGDERRPAASSTAARTAGHLDEPSFRAHATRNETSAHKHVAR
jgi:hypothetical protein